MKRWKKYKFVGFWLLCALVTLAVYQTYAVDADFLGVVETRTHKLSAQESGRIQNILVALGDPVSANQLLVRIDTSDLDAEQDWLKHELKRLEDMESADRSRYALEYEKLRLQSDADLSRLEQWRSDLEGKKAELRSVNTAIERLEQAQQAGLGRAKELTDLTIRRNALNQLISKQTTALKRKTPSRKTRTTNQDGAEGDRVVLSMLGERLERINEIKLRLKIIETRKDRSQVITPCAGRVVKINYMPGDAVEAFQTILTVEEPHAEFIDVYVPETSNRTPHLNERVAVFPHRTGTFDSEGTVVFVDPGFSAVPERLAFRKLIYWARKFRVQLDANHHLMPGEAAHVRLLGSHLPRVEPYAEAKETNSAAPANREKQSPASLGMQKLTPIQLPQALHKRTRFEPSALAWLPDLERYLVLSDDTGRKPAKHQPWLFLMDLQGNVEPEPILLKGVESINDLEALAMKSDQEFYFVSSQNLNKKGKRTPERQYLLHVKREGRSFEVLGKVALANLIFRSYDETQRHDLGLEVSVANGQPLLNIEGAVWYENSLLLGLKQPISRKGALLWRLDDPDSMIQSASLKPKQLSLYGTVNLRTTQGQASGISGLALAPDGSILALSTVPDVGDDKQCGGLYRVKPVTDGILEVHPLLTFPTMKPEGVCVRNKTQATLVFDTNDATSFTLDVGI